MLTMKERKSFICELSNYNRIDDDLFKIVNQSSQFSQVWIQGIVLKVNSK